jgi:hypothetical protein
MRAAGLTAEEAISAFKIAGIRREFPGQFLHAKLEDIEAAAQLGDPAARRALKLLFDRRFDKA